MRARDLDLKASSAWPTSVCSRANERPVVSGFILESPAMYRVIDVARRVAQVDSTVLLTGESGVGKERIARFIHDESSRAGGPYRKIKQFGDG